MGVVSPILIVVIIGGLGVCLSVGLLVYFLFFHRKREEASSFQFEPLDLHALPQQGPPKTNYQLEFYNVPVRVAVLVLAPSGKNRPLPNDEADLRKMVDHLLPGLVNVLDLHQPKLVYWPAQLSTRGFTEIFKQYASLPGNLGQGTPWCTIAGRFEAVGTPYLAGFVLRSEEENGLSHFPIERSLQWLDVLRIKTKDL
ncbi:MAG: hypothetical protein MPJ24_06005 [Pirellulaceae bacterium]|nr:hypothetical protein [Pirellulaceae bacterium]